MLAIGSREGGEAAAAGLGIGIVFAREHVADARLVARDIKDDRLSAVESIACLAQRRTLPVIAAFWAIAEPQRARS